MDFDRSISVIVANGIASMGESYLRCAQMRYLRRLGNEDIFRITSSARRAAKRLNIRFGQPRRTDSSRKRAIIVAN